MRGQNETESVTHVGAATAAPDAGFGGGVRDSLRSAGNGSKPEAQHNHEQNSKAAIAVKRDRGEKIEQLLARAAAAGRHGNREKSLSLFRAAAGMRPRDLELQLEIAQTLIRLGHREEAADRCRHILERNPRNIRAAQILAKLGAHAVGPGVASDAAGGPSAAPGSKYAKEIRNIRKLRKSGQPVTAEARCRQILEAVPDHLDASVELAFLLRQREAYEDAFAQLEIALARYPDNPDLLLQLAPVLRGLRRYDEARAALQKALDREPGNAAALHGLAKLSQRLGEWPQALRAFEALVAAKPDDTGTLIELASLQFEMSRYEDAEATLRRAEAVAGAQESSERYLARKFQYFCVTGQWERAQECMVHWPDHRAVPRGSLADVVRFYAERDRWNDVIDFLRDRVVDGEGGGGPRSGETLLGALAGGVRHTGRYAEALEMLDKWPGDDAVAVRNLREQIAEEIALLDAVGLRDSAATPDVSEDVTNPVRAERRARMNRAFSRVTESVSESRAPARDTVYYCTDAKYILGAAVSLFSLLRNNPGPARNCDFIVYCPPALLEFASITFGEIGSAASAAIGVRSSAMLLDENLAFRTKWGAFTLGRGLSIAAYYRIFAAIQLRGEKRSGRALYIDADTCIGPGIGALLRFDLGGQPVAVRREDPLGPGIMRACSRLGIARGEYFNSGVLLFNLAHPQLEAALNHSIEIALNKQHLLTMVDQCALNVGFRNQTASLPPEFNFFVRDDDRIELPAQPTVVTHYTAHPKPWDPSYQARHCLRWCDEFEALGAVLAPDHMKQLFAYSFPQRYGAWQGRQTVPPAPALHSENTYGSAIHTGATAQAG
ncbi:MAG TPA: tetratricopeptide repeat protein [Rhizomicrobium sp.]|jgi:lipopolysaccharide biosynthesis glycosyltransferase/Flp pilus assembly protein TadD|nr:tetratricopeptide repeat protein [Rhizomicrobium sp.]